MWQWQDLPFGIAAPTGSVTVALRYPGQYHEAETGLFQNWNRTYDKASGRYLESDRIGLSGGVNTFGYVGGNPLRNSDPLGLDWSDSIQSWWQSSVAGFQSDTPAEMVSRILQGLPIEGGVVAGIGAIKRLGTIEQCLAKGTINPNAVKFSQNSIKGAFSSGGSISELSTALRSGIVKPSEIPPIRLVERNGYLYSLDNRRLEAFRRAGMDVPYRMATSKEAANEAWKFSTLNNGTSIRIRGE